MQINKALVFRNDGCLDLNALRIMGVSVKESSNPIGFFGTGLKYAVATTLRLGGRIEIYIDGEAYTLASRQVEIRGKSFSQICLNGEPLGFTTELGKQWEAWMAVRELLSNARDEGGTTELVDGAASFDFTSESAGKTIIALYGDPFVEVWKNRNAYFLREDAVVLEESDHCQIMPHTAGLATVFYKGIRITKSDRAMMYTYNLKGNITLTEDRTLAYQQQLRDAVCKTVVKSEDEEFLEKILTAPELSFEHYLDFDISESPSHMFREVARRLHRQQPRHLNKSAIRYFHRFEDEEVDETILELTDVQRKMLQRACEFIKFLGYKHELEKMPIVLVNWLGEEIHGQAKLGKIYLAKRVFDYGTKYVASTILEELIHNQTGYGDLTRELQTHLFDKIISMGEEMKGEPL